MLVAGTITENVGADVVMYAADAVVLGNPNSQAPIAVLGAGPAGLTAAQALVRRGRSVVVLEADDAVGGIARTVERDGYRFDLGGHRFFTKSDEVRALWDETLRVNLNGVFHCTRAALESLLRFPFARVVNVASTAGLIGYPQVAAYCAAKHGVIGFTRALALEIARTGVTVNAVCPGYADTAIASEAIANIARSTDKSEAQAREALERRNPQRRLIAPDEVAATVAWLCLPESQSINGQAISLSGGEVMTG